MFKWFKQTNDKDDMPNTVVKAVTIVRARPSKNGDFPPNFFMSISKKNENGE